MREMQKEVHQTALNHGWWDNVDRRIVPEKIALVHSELSEALECYRDPELFVDGYSVEGKPEGFGFELADAIIRIFDLAEFLGLDMENLVREKNEYNKSRAFRHGNKLA